MMNARLNHTVPGPGRPWAPAWHPRVAGALLAIATMLSGGTAFAQVQPGPEEPADRIVYRSDFFAPFNPVNALEMIRRMPGFTFDQGSDVRGLAGAAGNVLIDGELPSAKGQALTQLLTSMSANQVERIELVTGLHDGGSVRGQNVVANVVRRSEQASGTWQAGFTVSEAGDVSPDLSLSATRQIGGASVTTGLRRRVQLDLDDQVETVHDRDGRTTLVRDEEASYHNGNWSIRGGIDTGIGGWRIDLNGEVSMNEFNFDERSVAREPGANAVQSVSITEVNSENDSLEAGATVERRLGQDLSLTIIGLQRLSDFTGDQHFSSEGPGSLTVHRQDITRFSGETVLRAELDWQLGARYNFDVGAEVAYNFLDSGLQAEIDLGSGPMPVDVPISSVLVEELRFEPFVALGWQVREDLSVELGLAFETSTLTQSGDSNEERTLSFLKPTLVMTWDPQPGWQVRATLVREVAQLDFEDFVTSVSLNEATTDLGNPELEPARAWRARLDFERRFSRGTVITFSVEREWLSAVQDLVPIENAFDAPGNIGDGELLRIGLQWQVDLRLVGLAGASVQGSYWWADSEVTDPVTGRLRVLSYRRGGGTFQTQNFATEFRHTVPGTDLTYGLTYRFDSGFREFRLREERVTRFGDGGFGAYLETSRYFGVVARIAIITGEPNFSRSRVFYDGSRANGVVLRTEDVDRSHEYRGVLSIQRAF